MEAGKLDRRLTLLQLVKTTNAMNEEEESWTAVGTVWASKEDVSDKERAEQARTQEVQAITSARFRVRYSTLTAQVRPTWRLLLKAKRTGQVERTYDVRAVKDINGDLAGLEFSAEARAE